MSNWQSDSFLLLLCHKISVLHHSIFATPARDEKGQNISSRRADTSWEPAQAGESRATATNQNFMEQSLSWPECHNHHLRVPKPTIQKSVHHKRWTISIPPHGIWGFLCQGTQRGCSCFSCQPTEPRLHNWGKNQPVNLWNPFQNGKKN